MGNIYGLFNKFFGKIILTKKRFLKRDLIIILYISHNLKIVKNVQNVENNNNFNENTIINLDELKIWAIKNNFIVTCKTNNSSIKRQFYTTFDDEYYKGISSKKKGINLIQSLKKLFFHFLKKMKI